MQSLIQSNAAILSINVRSHRVLHLPHPCLCLQVIIVDWDPNAVSLQPRNALILPKWRGANDDATLVDLAAFVRTVASMGVDDVRTVLDHYNDSPNPLETFKQNQALLLEQQRQQQAEDPKNKPLTGLFNVGLGRKRWSRFVTNFQQQFRDPSEAFKSRKLSRVKDIFM